MRRKLSAVFPGTRAPSLLTLLFLLPFVFGCAHTGESKLKEKAGVHYRLGNEYYKAGKLADALKEYTRAVEIYPDEPSYHLMLGYAYDARGLEERAEAEMKDSVRLDPMFSEGHIGLAFLAQKRGDWDEVIRECQEALKNIYYKTPEAAYLNMGIAYYEKGDYASSVDNLGRAISLRPGFAVAYYNLGLALERQKKRDKAISVYRKALKYRPDYVEAYYRLGFLLVKKHDKDGAVEAFEKVLDLAPESEEGRSAREYLDLLR